MNLELLEKIGLIFIICTASWIPFHARYGNNFEYYGNIVVLILGILLYYFTSFFKKDKG